MLSRAGTLPTPTLHFTPPILIIRFSYTHTKRPYSSYRPHTHQPTTHLSYVSQTYMYKNQVPIIILTNKHTYPIHRAWGIKIVENARKWDNGGGKRVVVKMLRFTQIAQSHFATALRMQSLYTYKCGQFYLKMHKIHICKHGILSVWIILIKSLNSIIYDGKTKLYEIDTCRGV